MKTVWCNGTFYTMEQEQHQIEALLTEKGKIIAIGSYEQLYKEADEAIDLQGAVLYPGFIDSHMHVIGHGEMLIRQDLAKATSTEELLELVQIAAQHHIEGDWILADGWDENRFSDQRLVTRFDLDAISTVPMALKRTCRHMMLVNSAALAIAGITKETPDPVDGVIDRDETGEPTGYLKEGAMKLVQKWIPQASTAYLVAALKAAIQDLTSKGLTGAVTEDLGYYGSYVGPYEAYRQVIGHHCKFRAHLLQSASVFEQMQLDGVTFDEEWIELGAMKFFVDGALGGKTALLSESYSDEENHFGIAVHSDEKMEELVKMARFYKEAIAVHVIGDAAVEKALDVIEKYPVVAGKRDRLIHVNVLRDDLVERMARLPIVLDLQPVFVSSDFPWVMNRLGTARLDWAYAWKRLLERGFVCGGGSDAPVEYVDPLLGIYAAVARKKPGEQHNGYLPEEKLSRFEAVRLFTEGSAATIGKDSIRGKLAVGFDADFTILDRDLFRVKEEDILQTNVVMTVIAGEIVYRSNVGMEEKYVESVE